MSSIDQRSDKNYRETPGSSLAFPKYGCKAIGTFTVPSSFWWFSSSITRIRGVASAVLFRVKA
jgi:hypothetical protein